ncbi:hypothetical protein GF369_02745 [Candidatus Peregrinibacteria bacterium]|nr:hypothetical protein [Candidatus Peregrinibacteria bacterium]
MKKLALAGIVSILATVALSGCMSVPEEDTQAPADETTPVVEDVQEEETDVEEDIAKDEVEDTEEATEEEDDKFTIAYTEGNDLFYGCSEEAIALNETLNAGEIMMFKAFESDSMDITLYKTENPDKLTKEEVEAIVTPCGELGSNQVLEVTDEYMVVGYPYCTGGLAPDPELQPEQYADYEACMVVQEELADQFELE